MRFEGVLAMEGQADADGNVWSKAALQALADQTGGKLRTKAGKLVLYASCEARWVRCTPRLINAGIHCASAARRPGGMTHSHDHLIDAFWLEGQGIIE